MSQSALVSPYALDEGIRGVSFPLQHVFYMFCSVPDTTAAH